VTSTEFKRSERRRTKEKEDSVTVGARRPWEREETGDKDEYWPMKGEQALDDTLRVKN